MFADIFDLFNISEGKYFGIKLALYALVLLGGTFGIGRWAINRLNYLLNRGYGRIVFGRNNLKSVDGGGYLLQLRNLLEEIELGQVVLDPVLRDKVIAAGKHCSEKQPFPVLDTEWEQRAWLDANLGFISRVNQLGELAESLHQPVVTKWVWLVPACADGASGTIAKFRTIWIGDDTLDKCGDPKLFRYERDYHKTRGNTLKMIYDAVRKNNSCIQHKGRTVQIAIKMEVKMPVMLTA